MNVILLIILYLLAIIGLISIIVIIYTIYKSQKYKTAMMIPWLNKLKCEEITCPRKIVDLPIPTQTDVNYDSKVARYLADLIIRIENSVNDPPFVFVPPKVLKEELKLYNNEQNPLFGILWSNEKVIYICFRGTIDSKEWIQDFNYIQNTFSKHENVKQEKAMFLRSTESVDINPEVHGGFLNIYNNFRDKLLDKIVELNPVQVLVSGHSLGAGIATICGLDLKLMGYNTIVYNFASPRVGDNTFCDLVKSSNLPLYRIVNTCDIVPTLPPPVCPNFKDAYKPYIYTHCGQAIYFTDNWKSITNNHLMGVYSDNIMV